MKPIPIEDRRVDSHDCGVYLCCLRHLVNEVMEYAQDMVDGVTRDQLEEAYELLFTHIEEAWEPLDRDITAPADPYAEQRADFEDDTMADLLKP